MTKKQALAEAVKRWGKTAAICDDGVRAASTPESRAAASAALKKEREQKVEPIGLFNNREQFPDTMPLGEYRAAVTKNREEIEQQRKRIAEFQSAAWRQRYKVGTLGLGFFIRASGDSWEDCFKKADESDERDRERYRTAGSRHA